MLPRALSYWPAAVLLFALAYSPTRATESGHQSAIMIDTAEYDWCHYDCAPFDRPTFFFCFQVADQILVGSRKADWIWMYDSSQMLRFKGKEVSVRFNADSIWIIRTDGKELQLTRDYSQDLFTRSECVAEVHRNWLSQFEKLKRPLTIPAEAVLIPLGMRPLLKSEGPHFWVSCSLDPQANWDLCTEWDEKGHKYKELKFVSASDHKPILPTDLVIDPLTTRADYDIHLKNGTILQELR
jgi:hypothetical protein